MKVVYLRLCIFALVVSLKAFGGVDPCVGIASYVVRHEGQSSQSLLQVMRYRLADRDPGESFYDLFRVYIMYYSSDQVVRMNRDMTIPDKFLLDNPAFIALMTKRSDTVLAQDRALLHKTIQQWFKLQVPKK
ncbi:MAG: hypothetical protein ISR65_17000 [Bacteriovoracaceae bacterium]|nr:hypothetical protein [Bacteriovoracaceae bacterium]